MMISEFLKLAKVDHLAPEEYDMIEIVYTYHPAISDTKGKEEIVKYWKDGLIRDMYPRAKDIMYAEFAIEQQRVKIDCLNEEHERRITKEMEEYYNLKYLLYNLKK